MAPASDQAYHATRNRWRCRDAEEDGVVIKLVTGQENVIYTDDDGLIYCMYPKTGELYSVAFRGFELERQRIRGPAKMHLRLTTA